MNEHDKTSQDIPHADDPNVGSQQSRAGGGRSWETGSAEGFSSAEPPESDAPRAVEEKSPLLAGLMAFVPGVGHFYLGATNRGLFFLGSFLALVFATNSWELQPLRPLFGLLIPFLLVYNVVDAVRGARAINRAAVTGGPAPTMGVPWVSDREGEDARLPGWVLIAVGVLLLGVTRFDWELDWLIDWWPVALIVIGVRMIRKGSD